MSCKVFDILENNKISWVLRLINNVYKMGYDLFTWVISKKSNKFKDYYDRDRTEVIWQAHETDLEIFGSTPNFKIISMLHNGAIVNYLSKKPGLKKVLNFISTDDILKPAGTLKISDLQDIIRDPEKEVGGSWKSHDDIKELAGSWLKTIREDEELKQIKDKDINILIWWNY